MFKLYLEALVERQNTDYWLDASEAKDIGLINHIELPTMTQHVNLRLVFDPTRSIQFITRLTRTGIR